MRPICVFTTGEWRNTDEQVPLEKGLLLLLRCSASGKQKYNKWMTTKTQWMWSYITEGDKSNAPVPLAVGFSTESAEFSAFMGFGAHLSRWLLCAEALCLYRSIDRYSVNWTCSCLLMGVPSLDHVSLCKWMQRHWGSWQRQENVRENSAGRTRPYLKS